MKQARRAVGVAAVLLGLTVALTGCGAPQALRHEDEVAQSVAEPAAPAPAPVEGVDAAAEVGHQVWASELVENTQCDEVEQTLNNVRIGHHEGFDRIVFDLSGTAQPCYRIFFDPDPVQDGSGNQIVVGAGNQALRVEISGLGPEFPTIPPGYGVELNGSAVTHAFFDTFFEGVATSFIAVHDGAAEFSVQYLPGKLIVDVRQAGVGA